MTWLLFPLLWAHGLAYTILAFKDVSRPPAFYLAGVIGGLLLGGASTAVAFGAAKASGEAGAATGLALGGASVLVIGAVFHAGFLAKALAELIGELGRRGRGDHQLIVKKTYDQAEAAEKRHDWPAAEQLYREEAEGDPEDGAACARLAEVLLKQHRAEEAMDQLARALERIEEAEKLAPLYFRLAELRLAAGQADRARAVLQQAVERLAGTRYEAFANKRLAAVGGY